MKLVKKKNCAIWIGKNYKISSKRTLICALLNPYKENLRTNYQNIPHIFCSNNDKQA